MLKLKYFFIITFLFVLSALNSYAEFLETSPNIFQHINGEYKIVVTSDGIFAMQTKQIEPEIFSQKDITKDNVISSCFLRYNIESKKYQELYVNGRNFLVNGTLNLKLGNLSINIDGLNTYSSFVVYDDKVDGNKQGILGIVGTSVVTNTTGSAFVALLEANSLSSQNDKISEYQIKNNMLYFNNKLINEGENIGTATNPLNFQNTCYADNAVILDNKELEEIKKLGAKGDTKGIDKIFNSKKSKDVLKDLLIIRVKDSNLILLDYINANIKIAKNLGETATSNRPLCLIKNIDIE